MIRKVEHNIKEFKPQSEWTRYKVYGDKKAREKLILQYTPLVKYVVERMRDILPSETELDDLISYGVIGLIDAIEKYDYNRGIKFETYSIPRIRGAIVDELRISDYAPRSLRQKAKKLMEACSQIERSLGRLAKDKEIAEKLNLNMKSYNKMLCDVSKIPLLSLDDFIVKNGDSQVTIGEKLADKAVENPSTVVELKDIKETLTKSIENLTGQERTVVSLYYYEGLTLKETSNVLNLSESRVSQIRTKAVLRLRGQLEHLHKEDVF
ncbi:MAG TPA: FliA/WhiG family RNA polymerase sigma factor [Actinobacteria bacterium]|nr:FliA/WhiG family RNA polymerase sigma factor [Actinomycetota bacterium]